MSHIWAPQVGAITQRCSQGSSLGTALTNTCSLLGGGGDMSTCLFAYTLSNKYNFQKTPLWGRFLWLYTFGACEGERLTYSCLFSLNNLSGSFMERIVNELTPFTFRASPPGSVRKVQSSPIKGWCHILMEVRKRARKIKRKEKGWLQNRQAIINTEKSKSWRQNVRPPC